MPISESTFNAANNRLATAGQDSSGDITSHPYVAPGGSMIYEANKKTKSFMATGLPPQTK